jgi:hypothetical protein
MASESVSGGADENPTGRVDLSDDRSEAAVPAEDASTADAQSDPGEWIASFRDVHLSWDEPLRAREPARWWDDEGSLSPEGDLHAGIDSDATGDDTGDSPDLGAWWRASPDEQAVFGVDDSPAFQPETDDGTSATSAVAPSATATALGDMPKTGTARKRLVNIAAVAAVVAFLVVAGAVLVFTGRNDGAKSRVGTARTATSESPTTTGSRAVVTTTIAPAGAPSTPSASPSTPVTFTVLSTCGGRDCTVAVRDGPSTVSTKVGSLRAGAPVQISCSTHGELIEDTDTGQRSDTWYRLADTNGYSSAVYLQGPTVPDCR